MTSTTIQKQLVQQTENLLNIHLSDVRIPKQGLDSDVFIMSDKSGNEYVLKYSKDTFNDVVALNLIKERRLEIPVPEMLGHFTFEGKTGIILEKINFPLLESIPVEDQPNCIPSMLGNLKKLHSIKSKSPGLLTDPLKNKSWKELLLFKYSGEHPWYNWEEILKRKGVDAQLMQDSITSIIQKIESLEFDEDSYSLIHTDFNQRNLFINPESHEVAGIIDWSEAMFGDPLYDFARVRMYIWHFDLGGSSLVDYFRDLKLTVEEKKLEDLYLVSQIIDYVTWYSQINWSSRLQKHQSFLREYEW